MGKQYDGVRAASESTIEIDFYYAGARCRERVKLQPTPANLKRAANHRAAVMDAIDRGTFDYAATFPNSKKAAKFTRKKSVGTVQEYLESWVDSKAKTIKASTADGYRKAVNGRLVLDLGAHALADLRRLHVKTMCEGMEVSNKRISNVLSVLRTALDEAVTDELIDTNPIAGWSYARNEAPKEEDDVDPFTAEEQARILDHMDGQGRNLVQFALWTGLRTSELVALQWADVDLVRGEVRIRRATTQAAKGTAEVPKTSSSKRTVKLLGAARAALEAQRGYTQIAGAQVFHNPRTDKPWEGDGPIRKTLWQPALQRAKVRYRYPYQTRHTYASMMLSAGEHPMWVASQMGHADWGMIRRVYGRWMPDAAPDAGSKAEALFGGPDGQPLVNIAPKTRINTG